MRINQYVAQATGVSRRAADALVEEGRVLVNGQVARLGTTIQESDTVLVDGTAAGIRNQITIMLNKPTGTVTSREQQGSTPTIYSILPEELWHLKPAGRLDKDSSGLLILTNDGALAYKLSHPSAGKWKRYEIETDQPLSAKQLAQVDAGVAIEDGISHMKVKPLKNGYEVLLQEGRNRQIRRTVEALGRKVTLLHRTNFGPYELGNLKPGQWRQLSDEELSV